MDTHDKSKPFPWEKLNIDNVSEHRNLDCSDYQWCLNYASMRYWESWTCLFCPKFVEPKKKEVKKNGGRRKS